MFIAEHLPPISSALTERMDERNAVASNAVSRAENRAENLRRAGFTVKQTNSNTRAMSNLLADLRCLPADVGHVSYGAAT